MSWDTADATVSRIAPPVRVNVTTAARSTGMPIHGGSTLIPSTGVARSGSGSWGMATRIDSPKRRTPTPTKGWKRKEYPMARRVARLLWMGRWPRSRRGTRRVP